MAYSERILYGFSDIKIKKDDTEYMIQGAINCEVNLTIDSIKMSNKTSTYTISSVVEAEGRMEILGLSLQEEAIIFGYEVKSNSEGDYIEFGNGFNPPHLQLSFSQLKANGKKIVYNFPDVVFKPTAIGLSTIGDSIEEKTTNLEFVVNQKDGIYYKKIENI